MKGVIERALIASVNISFPVIAFPERYADKRGCASMEIGRLVCVQVLTGMCVRVKGISCRC